MRNKSRTLLQFSPILFMLIAISCASPKPVTNVNQTGESQESALVLEDAAAEHRWINEHFPNARILVQEVVQQSGRSYDVITIRTEAEERKTFYFDISQFYKKK